MDDKLSHISERINMLSICDNQLPLVVSIISDNVITLQKDCKEIILILDSLSEYILEKFRIPSKTRYFLDRYKLIINSSLVSRRCKNLITDIKNKATIFRSFANSSHSSRVPIFNREEKTVVIQPKVNNLQSHITNVTLKICNVETRCDNIHNIGIILGNSIKLLRDIIDDLKKISTV